MVNNYLQNRHYEDNFVYIIIVNVKQKILPKKLILINTPYMLQYFRQINLDMSLDRDKNRNIIDIFTYTNFIILA